MDDIVGELRAERDWLRADLHREREVKRINDQVLLGVIAERDRLRAVVADIAEHATPIAEDGDGFVSVGYTVTVGAVHRAIAALQGSPADDPLHPLMPTGADQVFRDWLDFVERVARPIVEAEDDAAAEQTAMALYRKASPFFICAALVMATNERDRLRAVVDAAMLLWYATYPTGNPRPELVAARNDFEQAAAQLDGSEATDGRG